MNERNGDIMLICSYPYCNCGLAVAFTVPGGNRSENGTPIYLKSRHFVSFAIADALALIFALTSVLIFLSVLTLRYPEEDFLVSLLRKLIIGLSTLFFSIASMAIAFSSTYFIMFSDVFAWVPILLASLICLVAGSFVVLQFPIFAEILKSIYGPDVLYRQP
ncbi:hypothetical protein GIB67_006867 [Kingdonia uniflora]|uniref:PGG domain-containing protein n=1 Tax=Kingdonia uniflora TaxID=39325 RepID=A0A7J7L027_9MAGN|nr:hypothetical protein GIB67_006867 [Kingdonia uniflora]